MTSLHRIDYKSNTNTVLYWLSICAFLVLTMIILGGYTRLKNAGLSIVEWKPITGIIPPITEQSWNAEFEKYKGSPEFQLINFSISLQEFKHIFFIEYFHRLLGRIVGLVYLIPMLYFYWNQKIRGVRYLVTAFLIGMQGFIGWYMVKSGLTKNPHVSHYRLALHMLIAVIIYGHILVLIFRESKIRAIKHNSLFIKLLAFLLKKAIFVQIGLGALTAGLDAGLVYNEWPLMGGAMAPPEFSKLFETLIHDKETHYFSDLINIFNDPPSVQFIHRVLAYKIAVIVFIFCILVYKKAPILCITLCCFVLTQILLGILTVIFGVPLFVGIMHQFVAIILYSVVLYLSYKLL